MLKPRERGQAMAEYAIVMPILILLLFGMTLAAFYAYRAAAADWGVFVTGVAEGAYNAPATGQARQSVIWPDIRNRIYTGQQAAERQVRSRIEIEVSRPWVFGFRLAESQRGMTFFRLWRFYPGPPPPGGPE